MPSVAAPGGYRRRPPPPQLRTPNPLFEKELKFKEVITSVSISNSLVHRNNE